MPHATDAVNGEKPSSKVLQRLSSYPAVSDGIETFKANPYGKKSLELVDGAYTRFGKPVEPYLETPYAYVKPYVQKADELADSGFNRVETHFPIVKEDTTTIVDTTKSYAFWPYTYLSSTWHDEYTKTSKHNSRGPGVVTSAMAIVSTELRIAADFFHTVANFLGPKYEESKQIGADYAKQAQDTAEHYKQIGQDKVSEYTKFGQEKLGEAQKVGEQKTEEAKQTVEQTKNHAQHHAHHAKEEAHKKTSK